MHRKITDFLALIFVSMFSFIVIAEAQNMDANQALSAKQQSIVPIAAFTATGDMEKLKTGLNEGLDAGLTVNEIKEILVQMYAYAGFPRSLNAIHTFMAVMDQRQAEGVKDEAGKEASPLPAGMNKDEYGAKVRAKLAGQEVIHPKKVCAGKDMVALCCGLLGVKPGEVMHIQLAHESGLGKLNLGEGAIKHLRL